MCRGMISLDAARPREDHLAGVGVDSVDQDKTQVSRIGGQTHRSQAAHFVPGARIPCSRRQVSNDSHLTLADDALCVIEIRAKNPTRSTLIVGNRTVRECVIGLFAITVALHDEEQGFVVGAFVSAHGQLGPGFYLIPYFAPDLVRGLPERLWVLAANDRLIGVVVEVNQLVTPPHKHRLARGEHDSNARLEVLWPMAYRSERGARPVCRSHECSKFAAAGEQSLW